MKMRRIHMNEIARYYQRLINEENRKKRESLGRKKGLLSRVFGLK